MTEYKMFYRIKNPNGTFKQVYEYKDMGNGVRLIAGVKDLVLAEEDKKKIILIKDCTWDEIIVQVGKNEDIKL